MRAAVPELSTPLYYWTFLALVLVLLLNLLLAIVVDAFVVVKTRLDGDGEEEPAETFWESFLCDCRCRMNLITRRLSHYHRSCRDVASPVVPALAASKLPSPSGLDTGTNKAVPEANLNITSLTVVSRFAALRKAAADHRAPFIALGMSKERAAALVSSELQRRRHAASAMAGGGAVDMAALAPASSDSQAKVRLAAIEEILNTPISRGAGL